MSDEFSDIGSVKALLKDARERIKESEDRSKEEIEKVEKRLTNKSDEIEEQVNKLNLEFVKWLPLLTNLSKAEESKRNVTLMLIVAFISNVAAWILAIFIYFAKLGVTPK